MSDVIYIAGASGGAGATTCAIKLGLALSEKGERTLVIDGDAQYASGLEASGLAGMCVYSLGDAEEGACRVRQALLNHPSHPNFFILPTLGCKSQAFAEREIAGCVNLFDRVICDGVALSLCERALIVSEPYPVCARRAKKKAADFKDCGVKSVGLIVNKVNGGLVFDGEIPAPQEFSSLASVPLWGTIPEDLSLPVGRMKAGTKKAFCMTAEYLTGESDKLYGVIKPYVGLKGAIRRKLRGII